MAYDAVASLCCMEIVCDRNTPPPGIHRRHGRTDCLNAGTESSSDALSERNEGGKYDSDHALSGLGEQRTFPEGHVAKAGHGRFRHFWTEVGATCGHSVSDFTMAWTSRKGWC